MSFIVNGTTFYEPSDLLLKAKSTVAWVLCSRSNNIGRRVLATEFADAAHSHYQIVFNDASVVCFSGGDVNVIASGMLRLRSYVTGIKIQTAGQLVRTDPPGNNTTIMADAFAEHSSFEHKDNILDFDLPDNIFDIFRPRSFTMAGSPRYGFIVEELPVTAGLVVETPEGDKALSLMGMIAILFRRVKRLISSVKELHSRVVALETRR